MASDQDIVEFRSRLLAEINGERSISETPIPEFSENIFSDNCTDWLAEAGLTENPEVCFFEHALGNRTARVNGYAVSDDGETIDLFVAVFDGSEDGLSVAPEEFRRAARHARAFLGWATDKLLKSLDPGSDAYAMVGRVREVVDTAARIRIFVISDCKCSLTSIEAEELDGKQLVYELVDITRLYRLTQAGMFREEILVDFTEFVPDGLLCLHAPEISPDYEAYLALLPGDMLYRLYDLYGPRLLERNVRSFLQARGKVNRGIRDTLRERPDRFMAYNNGVVATVDEIEVAYDQAAGTRHITSVKGLQIVNGGQTTASIHRARRDDKVDLSSVYVPVKISLISEKEVDEIVPAISLYANSQNNIQMADFSANDPYHVEMSKLASAIWCPGEQGRWFYERTRGEYEVEKSRMARTSARARRFNEVTPSSRKFNKVELAKFILSWDQRPDKVSLGGQKCFVWFMQNIAETHSKDWLPDKTYYKRAIAKGLLYKEAMKIVRQDAFPGYRAQVVTYVISYLSHRTGRQVDLDLIWENQSLSEDLIRLIRGWCHEIRDIIVMSAGERNVTEWCKKEGCWKEVRALSLTLPSELPVEITGTESGGGKAPTTSSLSPADLDAIHRCQSVSAQDWIAISEWGKSSGKLKPWQSGIAGTLGVYAAQDWSKPPSVKQARQGIKILGIAESEGGPLLQSQPES